MTVIPSQINAMLKVYAKVSRAQDSLLERTTNGISEVEDVVEISTEAKRRQITEQTRMEVIKRVKETVNNGKE